MNQILTGLPYTFNEMYRMANSGILKDKCKSCQHNTTSPYCKEDWQRTGHKVISCDSYKKKRGKK